MLTVSLNHLKKLLVVCTLFVTGSLSVAYAMNDGEPTLAQESQEYIVETDDKEITVTSKKTIAQRLEDAAQAGHSVWLLFVIAFFSGILMSFTPCVYPIIPVTMSIMHGTGASSVMRNFLLALTYVTGIALVYAGLGYMAATTTIMFGRWVANPWVISLVVLFFLYFAFSLFGFYELYVPSFLQNRQTIETRGSFLRVFLFGVITGTVASPCLTPGLAVFLTLAAKIGNPIAGFLLLFFFALGMGMLLLLIGTFSGAVSLLPRSGEWLNETKRLMGFLMLAMSVYFAQPLLNAFVVNSLYGAIVVVGCSYFIWRLISSCVSCK